MRRVLVIDDHEPSRKILIDTLSQDGYQIAGEGATGNTAGCADYDNTAGYRSDGGGTAGRPFGNHPRELSSY